MACLENIVLVHSIWIRGLFKKNIFTRYLSSVYDGSKSKGQKFVAEEKSKEPLNKFEHAKNTKETPDILEIIQDPKTSSNLCMKNVENSATQNELSHLKESTLRRYNALFKKARLAASDGNLHESLKTLEKVSKICETKKTNDCIKNLEEYIEKSNTHSSSEMRAIADGFHIFHETYEKLYPYQRAGVAWMWGLYQKGKGGILADDTGMGKTIQIIAFLSGLIDAKLIKNVLIIMPEPLLMKWENEFFKWCPGIKVCLFHRTFKEKHAVKIQKQGHVLLTTYGLVVKNKNSLYHCDGDKFIWDYVILDEAHTIKNPTKIPKAVHEIPAKNRLVLTDIPIKNNLRELWTLYDFVHQGALFGSMKTFKMLYENKINKGREEGASVEEKQMGAETVESLEKLIKPYFLERTIEEAWSNVTTTNLMKWVPPYERQKCETYLNILHSEDVNRSERNSNTQASCSSSDKEEKLRETSLEKCKSK